MRSKEAKDDSSLINSKHSAVYFAAIGKHKEAEEKKTSTKDKLWTMYVQIPKVSQDNLDESANVMEEFVFTLDLEQGGDYYY